MEQKMRQYGVILCDPPWSLSNTGVNGAAQKHYPTLTDTQIKALPIERIAKDDSILVLWCINSKLDVGLDVIKSWGFKYVTKFPWIKFTGKELDQKKPAWGTGFWVRGCSEDILIAKRGQAKPPDQTYLGLLSDRLQHSRKPDSIYDFCEQFPGPYLELFGRSPSMPTPSTIRSQAIWDVWGNQVSSTIDLFEGLPKDYFLDSTIANLCATIGRTWAEQENSKWVIGDAVAQLIQLGIPPMQAYQIAAQKMNNVSIHWPLLMRKMSLTFPANSRDSSISWNQYREQFEQIRKIKSERHRLYTKRICTIRQRIDQFFQRPS